MATATRTILRRMRGLTARQVTPLSAGNHKRRYSSAPEYIVKSEIPELEFEHGNFTEYMLKDINKWQNNIAISCTESGCEISYAQLRDRMARWGGFLARQGIKKKSVVAVVAPNCAEVSTIIYGTIRYGAIYCGVNPTYTAEEIACELAECNTDLVVCYGPLEPLVRKAMAINKQELPLFSVGLPSPGGLPRVEDIVTDVNMPMVDPAEVTGDETMILLFSSGTTGKPKGTALSHNAGIANLAMLCHPNFLAAQYSTAEKQEKYMLLLPLFHASGFIGVGGLGLHTGLKLFTMPKFDPAIFIKTLITEKIPHLHLVPTLLNFMLSRPEFNKENFSHVKTVMSGTAPIPPSSVSATLERIGDHIFFQSVYGLTEVLVTHMDPMNAARPEFTGKLLPTVEAKILDLTTRQPLPPFKDGEICIKTVSRMKRYINNEKATSDMMDAEGWVSTGDVGHYDEDGYFRIVDRTKELIKVKGFQVSPSEIEDVILQIPEVVEVGVIGVPHDRLGEAPRAYVVCKTPIDARQVVAFVEKKMTKYKHLVGGVVFLQELPKNTTGKVMKKDLVKMAKQGK